MAIAPLPQIEELEELENPWPKAQPWAQLRLVIDPWDRPLQAEMVPAVQEPRIRRELVEHRLARASGRLRRRRLVLGLALLSFCVLMALPLRAIGTVTVSGQQTPGGAPAGLMDGTVYVVQPGDSLSSIAHKLSPSGDQVALVSSMEREVGSGVIVPGEHLLLP